MRMSQVAAGAISLHVGVEGCAFCRLETPERPNPRSQRYVLLAVPLECLAELKQAIRRFRLRKAQEKARELGLKDSLPPTKAARSLSPSALRQRAQFFDKGRERGMPRLGVRPVVRSGPVRPPILTRSSE
jgi:hypothetical protein